MNDEQRALVEASIDWLRGYTQREWSPRNEQDFEEMLSHVYLLACEAAISYDPAKGPWKNWLRVHLRKADELQALDRTIRPPYRMVRSTGEEYEYDFTELEPSYLEGDSGYTHTAHEELGYEFIDDVSEAEWVAQVIREEAARRDISVESFVALVEEGQHNDMELEEFIGRVRGQYEGK